jgi:hypothetical protein
MLRVRIMGATGLKRSVAQGGTVNPVHFTPSPFAIITVDGADIYRTLSQIETENPEWNESFDMEMSETSALVIRIFDASTADRERPVLLGYTATTVFSMLLGRGAEDGILPLLGTTPTDAASSSIPSRALPLAFSSRCVHGASVTLSMSTDVSGPPSPFVLPRHGHRTRTTVRTGVAFYGWGGRSLAGHQERTRFDTYRLHRHSTALHPDEADSCTPRCFG